MKNNIDALIYYDKAIHVHPQHILAYFYKGYVLYKMKKYKESIKCYDKVLKLNPNFAMAYNNKAITLKEIDKLEEAIEYFKKSLKINPSISLFKDNMNIAIDLLRKKNSFKFNSNWNSVFAHQKDEVFSKTQKNH